MLHTARNSIPSRNCSLFLCSSPGLLSVPNFGWPNNELPSVSSFVKSMRNRREVPFLAVLHAFNSDATCS
ncbi:hypothetical protein DPMN_137418 [Dreissena polymorpha]|uniref:Uncharacterized protein n=1 Tax=Dreissena polymorpha TaxID=45954 RepID=A0A9D4G5Q5_DREPO|nr:hypothetical protein DPMN_137418 [Dreissena polymorpha]